MDLGLSGKKAIITGGSRGIGRAIARTLLAEGASVAFCARSAEGVAAAAAEMAADAPGRVHGFPADMAHPVAVRAFIEEAIKALGGCDILVYNTSAMGGGDWDTSYRVDVLGAVTAVEAVTPSLEASEAGSIVFIGTTASMENFGRPGPYGPMKAAMRAYTRQLGEALAPRGIRVNVVSPGSIYFEGGVWQQVEKNAPQFFQAIEATIPMGRYGSDDEVARVVTFVASPAASWVTGTNIVVDGGQHKSVD